MAPTEAQVEYQTQQIIRCLFDDDDDVCTFRQGSLDEGSIEADGPEFDPVLIADKLKQVADAMNEDAQFKAALRELKEAAVQKSVEAAFENGVNVVLQSHVSQKPEVAPEMQLITAAVAFGLYVKKSSPNLKIKVQSAVTSFLNKRVGSWVKEQGGWDKVAC